MATKSPVDISKFWFRLQVLMHMESVGREEMQLCTFRNLHTVCR